MSTRIALVQHTVDASPAPRLVVSRPWPLSTPWVRKFHVRTAREIYTDFVHLPLVTVVDAFRFFSEFDTAEFLQDRFGKEEVPEEDQRTISDLFADQIEFANVILVNKVDRVDANTLGRVKAYVKTLNPTAKIIETRYSKVDVREMLNTSIFNFSDAVASPGWLKSLHEMTVMDVDGRKRVAPKPETLE